MKQWKLGGHTVSNKETIRLADLRAFAAVAEHLSVTKAALALGESKSAVSKALTRLEADLGVRLLERTSRRVLLTPAGRVLVRKASSLLDEARALAASLRAERDAVEGVVHMTAPPELGNRFIEHVLPRLLRAHPNVRVAMNQGYGFDDILDPAIDLGLRAGDVRDDRLVARPIGVFARIVVASPALVACTPVAAVGDLATTPALIFSATDTRAEWTLSRAGRTETVWVTAAFAARSFTALLHAARAGLGVARIPGFAAQEWIARGELAAVLPGWTSPPTPVFAVHRFGQERIGRVRVVLEAMTAQGWLTGPALRGETTPAPGGRTSARKMLT